MKKLKIFDFLFGLVSVFLLAFSGLTLSACGSEYVVKFDANGGEGQMEQIVVKDDEIKQLPQNLFTPTQGQEELGIRFAGWSTTKDGNKVVYRDQSKIRVNKNMTLYAVWNDVYYITIDANGGRLTNGKPMVIEVSYGQNATLPTQNEIEERYVGTGFYYLYYGFVKEADKAWDYEEGLQYEDVIENVREDKTIYVYWDSTYGIDYVDQILIPGIDPFSVAQGSQFVVLSENEGVTLFSAIDAGFSVAEGTHLEYWQDTLDENKHYDGQQVLSEEEVMQLYTQTRGRRDYEIRILELRPVWETNEYMISFDSNNAENEVYVSTDVVPYGTEMFLPQPEELEGFGITNLDGFVFKGWALDRFAHTESSYIPGAQYVVGDGFDHGETITFYAIWEDESQSEINITFDANGGTGEIAQQSVYVGMITTIPNCTFEKEDFQCVGWALSPEGDVVLYGNEEIYVPYTETDITLYAIWIENDA